MFQTHTMCVFFSVLFSLSLLFGCGTPADGQKEEEKLTPATATPNNKPDHENNSSAEDDVLFLIGSYVDNHGTEHTITQQSWTQGSSIFAIKMFSNTEKYVITQNDPNNEYNPEKWSRFDWTIKDNTTWFCQTSYDSVTQEDAMAVTPAETTDPTSAGCSGFSWSRLDEPFALRGNYLDSYGTEHTITQQSWTQGTSIFAIKIFSNTEKYVITQNAPNNEYNPGKWSRFDWTIKDNTTWFCQTSYDSVTQEDAMAVTPADTTDPTSAGCSGFSWSKLIPEEG